jgi:hypothetical protein
MEQGRTGKNREEQGRTGKNREEQGIRLMSRNTNAPKENAPAAFAGTHFQS